MTHTGLASVAARALGAGAMLVALLAPAQAADAQKVAIGLGFAIDHLPIYVAKDKGIFEKHGLDVTLRPVPLPSNIGPALVSGDIQIGAASGISIFQGREAGLNFVVVAGETRNDRNNVTTSLVTRKGETVTKPADLKGKKVGIAGLNSGNYIFLAKWLVDDNVALKDVTFVEVPTPRMGDLLKNNSVDVVILPDPLRLRIVESGVGEYSVPVPTEVNPDSPNIFWASMDEWAKKNPSIIKAFRLAFAEAAEFIKQDHAAAREIEMKYVKVASPNWPTWSVKITSDDIKFLVEMGRQIGMLKDPAPADILFP